MIWIPAFGGMTDLPTFYEIINTYKPEIFVKFSPGERLPFMLSDVLVSLSGFCNKFPMSPETRYNSSGVPQQKTPLS
jgi:hypothetical protein